MQTCASISTFLTNLHATALRSLPSSGSNVSSFLTEIALGTRASLLDHFKRFTVNGTGGLIVTKDMTRYTELLRSWDLDDNVKCPGGPLDALLEVGNLFVVGPEALRERIRARATGAGGKSGDTGTALSIQEIRAYIMKREDSGSAGMQSVISSL